MEIAKEARSKYLSIAASGALVILIFAVWVRPAQAAFGLPANVWCAVAGWVGWTPATCSDPGMDEPPAVTVVEERAPSRPALIETIPGPPTPAPPVVENTYVTYPTTIIREEALTPFVDLSGLVTEQRFERQTDRIFSTIGDLAATLGKRISETAAHATAALADALADLAASVTTALLHVTGNATVDGSLVVGGPTNLATTTVARFHVAGDADIGGILTATFLSVAGIASEDAVSAPWYQATSTVATSSFAGAFTVAGQTSLATTTVNGTLTVNGNTYVTSGGELTVGDKIIAPGEILLGTSTPLAKLTVQSTNPNLPAQVIRSTAGQTATLFSILTESDGDLFSIAPTGALTASGAITFSSLGTGFLRVDNGLLSTTTLAHTDILGLGTIATEAETNYALLAGRAGGQTLIGGTGANNVLTLQANSAAAGNTGTNAALQFKVGNSGGTSALTVLNNGNVGFGTPTPGGKLTVQDGDIRFSSSDDNPRKLAWYDSGGAEDAYIELDGVSGFARGTINLYTARQSGGGVEFIFQLKTALRQSLEY